MDELEPLDTAESLWRALRKEFGLTRGGQIGLLIVGFVGMLGLIGVVADAVFGGIHGDQAGGVLLVFVVLALGVLVVIVLALDAGVRGARQGVRRLLRRSA